MFREDVGIATDEFKKALPSKAGASVDTTFGSEHDMFKALLDKALKIYGSKGLVDQEALVKTDFTNNKEELVKVVRDGAKDQDIKVQLIAEMAAKYMEMMIQKNKFPLTPHHTQVLAMLLFSEFYDNQKAFERKTSAGGYNICAVIMQMKTGEGKSIVIAMLAVFVVLHYKKRVHVLENNQGLLERDFAEYEAFYRSFTHSTGAELTCSSDIDGTPDICYCLKKGNNSFFNQQMTKGSDVVLDDVILIVDEVDDLVVNENPLLRYLKPDREQTVEYQRYYKALKEHCSPAQPYNAKKWKDAQRIKEEMAGKEEGKHYAAGANDKFVMLDENHREPKVPLVSDWLEYLNYDRRSNSPDKLSYFNALCTPFMYNKYSCIFGLTGSVGGEAERKYIKETYRAVAFEVPQFLNTCKGDGKIAAVNQGVLLERNHAALLAKVCELTKAHYIDVPVLVIARDPTELDKVHTALQEVLLISHGGKMNPDELQKLRERDDNHEICGKEVWNKVIEEATLRRGTKAKSYCSVTVTERFGGRGHDFKVGDDDANAKGGMLVIATSIPDTREWIQWKGRTARQDKKGQASPRTAHTHIQLACWHRCPTQQHCAPHCPTQPCTPLAVLRRAVRGGPGLQAPRWLSKRPPAPVQEAARS